LGKIKVKQEVVFEYYMNKEKRKARVIAIYLPQFHPIPENDKWWGKGFTEWTNVGKAKPLFRGHYQPRVPADLGYYDLRLPEIRDAQAKMAYESGVEGFMYWHYWFGNGEKVLERPFLEVLKSGKPDFPFCLGWANHSWTTSTWTKDKRGHKNEMILEQKYFGEQDNTKHFYYLLDAFKDKRYITIDDKPVFVIYSPATIPDTKSFLENWKKLAIENGLKGIHFVALTGGWLFNYQKVLDLGYDAIIPGNMWIAESKIKGKWRKLIEHKIRAIFPEIVLNKYRYKDIIRNFYTEFDKLENAYPSIVPQWDRSPRSGRNSVIYTGSTPELFKQHINEALKIIENKPADRKILFLRSWNEWAEGNYVEPDLKFGTGYLDAIKSCIIES
jgi:hypothetical protein